MISLAVLALLAVATNVAHAGDAGQFVVELGALLNARIDPIVDPGNTADKGHAHTIFGANNFRNQLNTHAQITGAECTSAMIQADKSNYWIPTLFWINGNGEYEAAWLKGARAYYMIQDNTKTEPFPEGFRMISGTATTRTRSDKTVGISYNTPFANLAEYLPNNTNSGTTNLPAWQFTFKIQFPACGTGALDSPDHFSHMAWPLNANNQPDPQFGIKCPTTHPKRFPMIQLEVYWTLYSGQAAQWRKGLNDINLILGTGDTLGGSLHADFVNGWDTNILKSAIANKQCFQNVDVEGTKCPAFAPTVSIPKSRACRYRGQVPDEDLGYFKPLKNLPGCNLRWDANVAAKPTACPAGYKKPGWTWPNVAWNSWENFPIWPLAVNFPGAVGKPTAAWLQQFTPTLGDKFVPWGSVASTPSGSAEDVKNNLDFATAPNQVQQVA